MSGSRPPVSPEVRALLDRERDIPALPAQVRARSLARARAALVAGRVTPPAGVDATARSGHAGLAKGAAACVAAAAIGVAAYTIGSHRRPVADRVGAPVVQMVAASPAPSSPAPSMPAPTVSAAPSPAPALAMKTQRSSRAGQSPDELRLLRQARAAVARQDFPGALARVAEHTRRFKDGRLAEEREALRVKALSGLGRTQEARRAADAFAARFPRSVLLPAVEQMPGSMP
jgi:hypothetical protein